MKYSELSPCSPKQLQPRRNTCYDVRDICSQIGQVWGAGAPSDNDGNQRREQQRIGQDLLDVYVSDWPASPTWPAICNSKTREEVIA